MSDILPESDTLLAKVDTIERVCRDMEHAVGGGMSWINHHEAADFCGRLRSISNRATDGILGLSAVFGPILKAAFPDAHSITRMQAAEALAEQSCMSAEEKCADLISALVSMISFGEEMEGRHLVGDEGCFWPVEEARTVIARMREDATGRTPTIASREELIANLEYATKLLGAWPILNATAQVQHLRGVVERARVQS